MAKKVKKKKDDGQPNYNSGEPTYYESPRLEPAFNKNNSLTYNFGSKKRTTKKRTKK